MDRSLYMFRRKKTRKARGGCRPEDASRDQQSGSPSSTSDESDVAAPSKLEKKLVAKEMPQSRRQLRSQTKGAAVNTAGSSYCNTEYYTHNCLLGLIRKSWLDEACPNGA